jgi:hypothetical protein
MTGGRSAPEMPLTYDPESFDEQPTDRLRAPWPGLATVGYLAKEQQAYKRTRKVLHVDTKLNRQLR